MTTLAKGRRIWYNVVKTHMALDGKAAGLQAKGWKELLETSLANKWA